MFRLSGLSEELSYLVDSNVSMIQCTSSTIRTSHVSSKEELNKRNRQTWIEFERAVKRVDISDA